MTGDDDWRVPQPPPRPVPFGYPAAVADALAPGVAAVPDTVALVDRHRAVTYRELDGLAGEASAALHAAGLRAGDRVAACLPNGIDLVVAFFGAMRLGLVWVGVNRALAVPEKEWLLDDAGVALVVADRTMATGLDGRAVLEIDPDALGSWLPTSDAPPRVEVDPLAPAVISYTSGTTGRPKGVVHSQHNMAVVTAALAATQVERGHVKGVAMPLTIPNVILAGPVETFLACGTTVCMDRIDAAGVAEWVSAHGIQRLHLPAATILDLVVRDDITPDALASLTDLNVGGSACPETLRERYRAKFGVSFSGGYGLTEAPTAVARENPGTGHVAGSSGYVLPQLAVTIVDEDGAPAPNGATGEICVGPATDGDWADVYRPMLGYWRCREAGQAALRGGLLHTGDVGRLDAEGRLHVADRRGDVINRGGANVYPAEIERVLLEYDDVAACAVVGRTHDRLGQEVVAFVEMAAGAQFDDDDLRQRCAANLARYKVPARFVEVGSWPRNAMGKIVKTALRAEGPHI